MNSEQKPVIDPAGELRGIAQLAGDRVEVGMPELHALYWRRAEAHAAVLRATRADGSFPDSVARPRAESEAELSAAVSGPSFLHLTRLSACERCLELRPEVEAGNGAAVMEAVAQCVQAALTVPGWLAAQFLRRFATVARGMAKSWEAPNAFGSAFPRATNIAGVFARENVARTAYFEALKLLAEDPEQALFAAFYDELSDRIGPDNGRGTKLAELIAGFVEGAGGALPPLPEMKPFLRMYGDAEAALLAWDRARQVVAGAVQTPN